MGITIAVIIPGVVLALLLWSRKGLGSVHRAASKGDVSRLNILLDRHPEQISRRDWWGLTAVQYAAAHAQSGALRLLMRRGANADSGLGRTPLQYAVYSERVDIVKLLLDHGVEIDATPVNCRGTALHVAVVRSNIEIVQLLLENGASLHAVDYAGRTPIDLAMMCGTVEVQRLVARYS